MCDNYLCLKTKVINFRIPQAMDEEFRAVVKGMARECGTLTISDAYAAMVVAWIRLERFEKIEWLKAARNYDLDKCQALTGGAPAADRIVDESLSGSKAAKGTRRRRKEG